MSHHQSSVFLDEGDQSESNFIWMGGIEIMSSSLDDSQFCVRPLEQFDLFLRDSVIEWYVRRALGLC